MCKRRDFGCKKDPEQARISKMQTLISSFAGEMGSLEVPLPITPLANERT